MLLLELFIIDGLSLLQLFLYPIEKVPLLLVALKHVTDEALL